MYPAPAIKCDGCANTIKGELGALEGVHAVSVDVESKRVSVEYDPHKISDAQIHQHLNQAGFPSPGPRPVTQ